MKIDLLDPVVEASPGQTALCRVRIVNDSVGPSAYKLRVVGLYDVDIEYPLGHDPLPAGTEARFDVNLEVPKEFAAGRHALAVEITSDRRDERPVLAGMTVDVSSIQKVALRINPSTISGRLRGRFRVEIDNREDRVVDLDLSGHGQDLDVRFGRRQLRMRPGDSVSVSGSVRGQRRIVRDPVRHVLTVAATGRSAPVYADAAFEQRPILPRRFRSVMAVLALLGLWAGIVGGGAYWYTQRDAATVTADVAKVDLNGDGVPDGPLGALNGGPGGAEAGGQGTGAAGGEGEQGEAGDVPQRELKPTSTIISGTVKAGDTGADDGVTVSITPAKLGGDEETTPAETAALSRGGRIGGGESRPTKVWPARYNRAVEPGVSEQRSTESVLSALSDGDGVWMFPDVAIPDNYELRFSKPGFDTQAFIVTPPEDGKPVEMEVLLLPADGAASGTVSGPNGPLGGVEIVITDGVLTFTTKTSSEAGSIGTWSVAGLSTPSTYTLTATLRGYGTEVQQVQLDPGQQRTGVNVTMTAGVGTISGHISAQAAPLGGVTITASSGDLSRTTTSLTLGDSGSYSLPQLKIPGTYTVTATAPGYMTQTRELSLTGNATDIDFSLIRTTGSITGLVVSDVAGNLPGVGITVLHDDLQFNSTTAAAPSAGTFRIDELPPGEYLVSFTRYDHTDVSQLVTIAAGETKDFGTVMMQFRARPPLVETGRLIVSVFDSATVPIGGATVQLIRIADGSIVRETTDTAGTEASFAFDNVPIGTYTVRVSRPSFRTATRRVTMGLGEVQTTFNLLQLGQVTGRIVDAVSVASGATVVQLNNYEVRLYRLRADGTRDGNEIERIVVPSSAVKDADGNILWQSAPTSLTDGTYEVEVSIPPLGYGISPTQAIDPGNAANLMRFTVDPTDEGTIRLNDIRADPYPTLSGRIYVPRLDTVDRELDPNLVGFSPLDRSAAVVLTCDGSTGSATGVLSDAIGPAGSGLDTYTFSPVVLDQQDLLGTCSLRVSSDAFRTNDVALGTTLEISSGGVSSDRLVNIAIGREPAALDGTVYWVDLGRGGPGGTRVPISTVNVITEGEVIIDFAAAAEGSTNLPTPILAGVPITGQNLNGTWSIAGQTFGRTTYVFTGDPAYQTGKLAVTIDENDRTVTVVQSLDVVDLDAASLEVQLRPLPGTIAGTVDVASVNPVVAPWPIVGVDAQPPGGTLAPATNTDPNTGGYVIGNAAAGTWNLTYHAPASGYRFRDSGALTAVADPLLVNPNSAADADPQLVKLATLSITVQGNGATALTGTAPTATLDRTPTGAAGDPVAEPSSIPVTLVETSAGSGIYNAVIPDLPVNWVDPTGTAASYVVTVTKDGYDTASVAVSLDGVGSTAAGNNIAVPLLAGENSTLTVSLSRFGSISGTVTGVRPWDATPPIAGSGTAQPDLVPPTLLTVTATRIQDLDGNSTPAGPTVTATLGTSAGLTTFDFVGPPGFYSITAAHPTYLAPFSVPVDGSAPAGLFRLANEADNPVGAFEMQVRPSAINVTAVDGGDQPIVGARIQILTGPTTGVPDSLTGADGMHTVGNLTAGTYTVEVRDLDMGGNDVRFPVRVAVAIVDGPTADARSVDLRVKLVSLDGEIVGALGAVNSNNRPTKLPDSMTITRAYTAGDTARVDGVDEANDADEDDLSPDSNPDNVYTYSPGVPNSDPVDLTLEDLPRGLHELSFSDADAYTTPGDVSAPITTASYTITTQINYVAADRQVIVNVVSGIAGNPALATAEVQLVPTWAAGAAIDPDSEAGGQYVFTVPPDAEEYIVSVTDDLHADNTATEILVEPALTDFVVPTITMTPSKANITGLAQQQEDNTTIENLTSNGSIELLDAGNVVVDTTTDNNGTYTFLGVEAAGNYRVRLTLAGHVTTTSAPFAVVLGQANTGATVIAPRYARATITVNTTTTPSEPLIGTMSPTGGTSLCTTSQCVFGNLDPSIDYTFTVSPDPATDDADYYWPDSTGPISLDIGGNAAGSVTLAQRDLAIEVSTPDAPGDATSATVVLRIPTGTSTPITNTTTGSSTYDFPHARLDAGTVTVSRTNYLTEVVAIAADASPAAEAAIPVVLDTAETDLSGTISGIPGGFAGTVTVRATSNASTPVVRTTSAGVGGAYAIDDLTWGTWTITADGLGAGAGAASSAVVVDGAAAATADRDITLVARDIDYAFAIRTGASAPITGADVTMGGEADTTPASGNVTLSVAETASRTWTVAADGYLNQTNSGQAIGSPTAATPVPVTMVAIPAIGGNVQGGNVPANVAFDNVFFCRNGADPATCAAAGSDLLATAPGAVNGIFSVPIASLRLDPGTYRLKAVGGTAVAETTITISAAGVVSPASITLTFVPRDFDYRFDVTNGSGNVAGAHIEMGGEQGDTAANGRVTLSVNEFASRAWTAAADGYINQSNAGPALGNPSTTTVVPVTLVALPAVGGQVRGGAGPVPIAFTSIVMCPAVPAGACVGGAPGSINGATAAGTGNFTVPLGTSRLAAGTYRVTAYVGAATQSAEITITAAGAAITPIVLTFPP